MSTQEVTREELQKQIDALKAQNAKLLAEERAEFRLAVSEKGAVSVYGMGRFPVSLYPEQWQKVLSHASDILQFITTNQTKLAKNQAEAKVRAVIEKQAKKSS